MKAYSRLIASEFTVDTDQELSILWFFLGIVLVILVIRWLTKPIPVLFALIGRGLGFATAGAIKLAERLLARATEIYRK